MARAERATASVSAALEAGGAEAALANATPYLHALGPAVIAWLWLGQATTASAALDGAHGEEASLYRGKVDTCRYFFRYELDPMHAHLEVVEALDTTCVDMAESGF